MPETNTNAEAARRALDTLLRNANARTVMLRIPAPAIAGDNAEQLGLATPLFEDIPLSPAVFRRTYASPANDGHSTRELLLSATTIEALTGSHDFASADALFASAFGVLIDDTLLSIVNAKEVEGGGAICGYRVTLREPVTNS